MFFEDGGVAPALRAVELQHQRCAVFHADLIDAVFVAVQGQQAAIAVDTQTFECIEYAIGRQRSRDARHAAGWPSSAVVVSGPAMAAASAAARIGRLVVIASWFITAL
jgi:hypothetical protein